MNSQTARVVQIGLGSFAAVLICVATLGEPRPPVVDCAGNECNGESPPSGSAPYAIQAPIPSGWDQYINWPSEPNIVSEVDVTPATFASNLVNGRKLNLADGDYGFHRLPADLTDFEISAQNPGGARFSTLEVWFTTRGKINGIRMSQLNMAYGNTDLLVDNVRVETTSDNSVGVWFGSGDSNNGGPRAYNRVALINSTVRVNGSPNGTWGFLNSTPHGGIQGTGFIVANCDVEALNGSSNSDPSRLGHGRDFIFVDNWYESVTTGNQFRMHNDINNVLISGNVFVNGAAQLYLLAGGDGAGAGTTMDNFYIIGNEFHTNHDANPLSAIGQGDPIQNLRLVDNVEYSTSMSGGSQSMPTSQGAALNSNNMRYPARALPARTQGASF